MANVRFFRVPVGGEPEMIQATLPQDTAADARGRWQGSLLNSEVGGVPALTPLGTLLGGNLAVIYHGNGVGRKLRTNRWNLLGNFLVVRLTTGGLLSHLAQGQELLIRRAMKDTDWLNKRLPLRHPPFFFFRHGQEATAMHGDWEPQLCLLGGISEIAGAQRLIDAHAEHLLLWKLQLRPVTWSVELQYARTPEGLAQMRQLHARYQKFSPADEDGENCIVSGGVAI